MDEDIINQKKTIVKNIGWLTISKIIVYILSIITITLIPRYLGVKGYGELNFALAFIGMFSIFGDLGLSTLILRDVSKNNKLADEYFQNIFIFKIILTFLFSIIILIITFFLNKALIVKKLIFILIFGFVFSTISNFILVFFQSFQKLKYNSISEIIRKVSYVLFILFFIYINKGVIGIAFSNVLMSFFGFLFVFISIFKYIKFKIKFNLKFIKKSLLRAWPFALSILFNTIYFQFDKIMISFMKGDFFVGLYSIGYTFYYFLFSILSVFGNTFFPVIAKYSFKKELSSIVHNFLYVILALSLPLTFGGIYLAKEIISLIFGNSFISGTISFRIILFFFLIASINMVFLYILYTHNFEKYILKMRVYATIANILLNFIAIPFLGIIGAAITTVISELIIFIGSYKKVNKNILKVNLIKGLKLPLISSIFMIFIIYIFKSILNIIIFDNKFNVLFYIFVGAISYFISLYILGGIKKEYIRLIIKLF